MSEDTIALLRSMLAESRQLGHDVGRVEGIGEASRVLLRMIDTTKDAKVREELARARRRIERLTTEPMAETCPTTPDDAGPEKRGR